MAVGPAVPMHICLHFQCYCEHSTAAPAGPLTQTLRTPSVKPQTPAMLEASKGPPQAAASPGVGTPSTAPRHGCPDGATLPQPQLSCAHLRKQQWELLQLVGLLRRGQVPSSSPSSSFQKAAGPREGSCLHPCSQGVTVPWAQAWGSQLPARHALISHVLPGVSEMQLRSSTVSEFHSP